MPYCEIELPGPQPEPAALLPTASESRVDRQSTIDQGDGGVNVFAEVSEHVCGIGEDLRVVTCNPNGSPRKIDSGMTARLRKLGPPVTVEIVMATRCPNKGTPVLRVAFNRLLQQFERVRDPTSLPRKGG